MKFDTYPQKPHGGQLVDQVVPESQRAAEIERARSLPTIRIDLEAAITIEMIARPTTSRCSKTAAWRTAPCGRCP